MQRVFDKVAGSGFADGKESKKGSMTKGSVASLFAL